MNDVLKTIHERASVRAFDAMPLTKEHEDAIIHAALRAPTAGNMQLYSILRVKNPETLQKLAVTCDNQPFIAKAPLALVFLADFQRWHDTYAAAGIRQYSDDNETDRDGATTADLVLCICDLMAAAQNAVIAAQSLGVASCYIGDILENFETHRELFDLPPLAAPVAMLVLGYPKNGKMPQPRPRFDPGAIVFDEKYRRLDGAELLGLVEKRENSEPMEWTKRFYQRKNGAPFIQEMVRSVEEMIKSFTGQEED